jgi:hypothetical protein
MHGRDTAIGFMREARRAGTCPGSRAMPRGGATIAAKIAGPPGLVPKSGEAIPVAAGMRRRLRERSGLGAQRRKISFAIWTPMTGSCSHLWVSLLRMGFMGLHPGFRSSGIDETPATSDR